MTVAVVAAVLLLAVPTLVALDRWHRARRARRQLVDALAAVPETAGTTPTGSSDTAAALATGVARRLGLSRAEVASVADATRLRPLEGVVAAASEGPWTAARAVSTVTTQSAISARTDAVLVEALTAPRGRAGPGAAVVRVVDSYLRSLGETSHTPSGALFAMVARHHTGYERRAAEALVHLVQGDSRQA
jgi:hypothetical protein